MKLKNIWKAIKSIFSKELDPEIVGYASEALKVTKGIKAFLDNPVIDMLTAIIPSNVDDKAVMKLRDALDKALPMVALVNDCMAGTLEERVECFGKGLLQYTPSIRNAMLLKLASLLTNYLHDTENGKQNMYDLITQWVYSNEINKND